MAVFDLSLFEALKPPFGKTEIVKFRGSEDSVSGAKSLPQTFETQTLDVNQFSTLNCIQDPFLIGNQH